MWWGLRDPIFYLNIIPTLLFLVAVTFIEICEGQRAETFNLPHIKPGAILIKDSMNDLLQESWKKVESLEKMKQLNLNYVNYEVGYLVHIIQNKYRKMLDRYHSAYQVIGLRPLFLIDLIILLEEIEHGYFQLDHILRMLSQVEKKYGLYTPITELFIEKTKSEEIAEETDKKQKQKAGLSDTINFDEENLEDDDAHPQTRFVTNKPTRTRRKIFDWEKYHAEKQKEEEALKYYYHYTKGIQTRWWWPVEYGWEIDTLW